MDLLKSLFYGFAFTILVLALLYIASIVWLSATHFYSIAKYLTLWLSAESKAWIQRLFWEKKTLSINKELKSTDTLTLSDLSLENETAPHSNSKSSSNQAKSSKNTSKTNKIKQKDTTCTDL